MFRVEPNSEIFKFYKRPTAVPEHLSKLEMLIKTRRHRRYYVVSGYNIFNTFIVPGFKKFKVIGWRLINED